MMDIISLSIALATTIVGTVVWGIRLEGRVNTQEAVKVETERKHDERYEQILKAIDRVETKLDRRSM